MSSISNCPAILGSRVQMKLPSLSLARLLKVTALALLAISGGALAHNWQTPQGEPCSNPALMNALNPLGDCVASGGNPMECLRQNPLDSGIEADIYTVAHHSSDNFPELGYTTLIRKEYDETCVYAGVGSELGVTKACFEPGASAPSRIEEHPKEKLLFPDHGDSRESRGYHYVGAGKIASYCGEFFRVAQSKVGTTASFPFLEGFAEVYLNLSTFASDVFETVVAPFYGD